MASGSLHGAKSFFSRFGEGCFGDNDDTKNKILEEFTERFGTILAGRVTLGGRLCTTWEVQKQDRANISELKRDLRTQLTATVTGAGVGVDAGARTQKESTSRESTNKSTEKSRMILETQGGDGLLASSLPDWTASVGSYRHWRTIRQDKPHSLLLFLAEVSQRHRYGEMIESLSKHAGMVQLKLRKFRPNHLDITAKVKVDFTYHTEQSSGVTVTSSGPQIPAFVPLTPPRPVFTIHLSVSQPLVVRSLRLEGRIRHSGAAAGTRLPDLLEEVIHRENMQEDLKFVLYSPFAESNRIAGIKLNQSLNSMFEVQLESYMMWDKEAEGGFPFDTFGNSVYLDWPDLEVNTEMHWELPIIRVQRPFSAGTRPNQDSLVEETSPAESVTGRENRQTRDLRQMLKKR